jgi:Tfp pilus assembly protein PilN
MTIIEINLLPADLRRKRRGRGLAGGFKIPLEVLIGFGGGLLMLLVLAHVGLLGLNITKIARHRELKQQMEAIAAEKAGVDAILLDMRVARNKLRDLSRITAQRKVRWSRKLNLISDALPRGVWLRRVAYNDGVLYIQGSAVSRQSNEMVNVHNFTASLKEHRGFFSDLDNFELGSIQRRNIGKVDVADFILTASLKNKDEISE